MKQPIEAIAARFDALAEGAVDFSDDTWGAWDSSLHQQVLQRAELDPDEHLLDLGCGTGRFAWTLAPHVARVTAVDASPGMLARARARAPARPNVTWVQADVRALPVPPGVTTAVAVGLLRLLDAAERAELLARLARALPPGGLVVVGDVLWSLPPEQVDGAEGWMEPDLAWPVRVDDLMAQMEQAGLRPWADRMHPALAVVRGEKLR